MNRSSLAQNVKTDNHALGGWLSELILDATTSSDDKIKCDVHGWEILRTGGSRRHDSGHDADEYEDDGATDFSNSPLNFDNVHQAMIPGVWHQIKLDSFPTNWVVLRFSKGSDTNLEMHAHGPGGLTSVTRNLSSRHVSFVGLRVSAFDVTNHSSLRTPGAMRSIFVSAIHIPANAPIEERQMAYRSRALVKSYFDSSDISIVLCQQPSSSSDDQKVRAKLGCL
jgi:hypothetical protein